MFNKPFRPPSFIRPPDPSVKKTVNEPKPAEPPLKKRRVSSNKDALCSQLLPSHPSEVTKESRVPLRTVRNLPDEQAAAVSSNGAEGYYMVLWRKFTNKKNKTWDGDGILSVRNGYAVLQDISGKELGKTALNRALLPGSALSIGGKDVEVDTLLSKDEFLAGRSFLGQVPTQPKAQIPQNPKVPFAVTVKQNKLQASQPEKNSIHSTPNKVIKPHYKNPILANTVIPKM
jgi:DNA repair and recombination protein RAD54B